jgi:hypothetical protein
MNKKKINPKTHLKDFWYKTGSACGTIQAKSREDAITQIALNHVHNHKQWQSGLNRTKSYVKQDVNIVPEIWVFEGKRPDFYS